MKLASLLLQISSLNLGDIESLGRRVFRDEYLDGGKYSEQETHDGKSVYFHEKTFNHAFYTTSDRVGHPNAKDLLAVDRIARIRWIEAIISGKCDTVECWEVIEDGREKRLYFCNQELYLVWLEKSHGKNGFWFRSAYTAPPWYIRKKCKSGKRIWSAKKGNAP